MYKICSLFAGVGGIDLGFLETNKCEIAYANEFDKYAVETYEKNFNNKVDCRDIHDVKINEIPDFDIMVGGFPCTSFSVAGYKDKIKCQVLNACEYGNISQNRERIYIVAFRDKEDFDRFQMPMPTTLDKNIKDVFNFDTKVDDKYYYTEGKYKGNIYKLLTEEMDDDNTVYQWRRKYVRKNQSNLVPTLTANMGEGRT